jgi:hypothetical protein
MKKPRSEWTDVFLSFRLTLDPRKLWLAFRGLVLSVVLVGLLLAVLASIYHAAGFFEAGSRPDESAAEAAEQFLLPAPAALTRAQPPDIDVWGALWRGRLGCREGHSLLPADPRGQGHRGGGSRARAPRQEPL